jgi:hypothetical protein
MPDIPSWLWLVALFIAGGGVLAFMAWLAKRWSFVEELPDDD